MSELLCECEREKKGNRESERRGSEKERERIKNWVRCKRHECGNRHSERTRTLFERQLPSVKAPSSYMMTGKTYKLIYFNLRGRAELARLILAQAGVEYDDHRIEKESWPELKPSKLLIAHSRDN